MIQKSSAYEVVLAVMSLNQETRIKVNHFTLCTLGGQKQIQCWRRPTQTGRNCSASDAPCSDITPRERIANEWAEGDTTEMVSTSSWNAQSELRWFFLLRVQNGRLGLCRQRSQWPCSNCLLAQATSQLFTMLNVQKLKLVSQRCKRHQIKASTG